MECAVREVGANLAKARQMVGTVCARGARLVVLPELFNTGYRLDADYHRFAEPIPGPTTGFMLDLARRHDIFLVGSIIEETKMRGIPFNTSVLVGPEGIIGTQSKIALYDREKLYFGMGDVARPFATDIGCIGLMICRDVRFGEIARALALKGAEVFAVSSAAGLIDFVPQARACDNSSYLVLANRTGQEEDTRLCGGSRIIDPLGAILAEAGMPEGCILAEIDTDVIVESRQRRRYLQDFRASLFLQPEFYGNRT